MSRLYAPAAAEGPWAIAVENGVNPVVTRCKPFRPCEPGSTRGETVTFKVTSLQSLHSIVLLLPWVCFFRWFGLLVPIALCSSGVVAFLGFTLIFWVVSPGRRRQPNRPWMWGAVPCWHCKLQRGGPALGGWSSLGANSTHGGFLGGFLFSPSSRWSPLCQHGGLHLLLGEFVFWRDASFACCPLAES